MSGGDAVLRPFHHLGYVVDDLEAAAERFARDVGAGPFLAIDHVPLTSVTYRGEPGHYDHSTAFGRWGPIIVELSVVHSADPPGLGTFLAGRGTPHIGHVGWLVDDLEAESARLEAAGLPLVHTGRAGPVQAHWHDGGDLVGHPIEVLRRCPEILGQYEAIATAARDWDGSRPLRPAPVPDGAHA